MYILIGVLIWLALIVLSILLVVKHFSFEEVKEIFNEQIKKKIIKSNAKTKRQQNIIIVFLILQDLVLFFLLSVITIFLWPLLTLILLLSILVNKMFKQVINY